MPKSASGAAWNQGLAGFIYILHASITEPKDVPHFSASAFDPEIKVPAVRGWLLEFRGVRAECDQQWNRRASNTDGPRLGGWWLC